MSNEWTGVGDVIGTVLVWREGLNVLPFALQGELIPMALMSWACSDAAGGVKCFALCPPRLSSSHGPVERSYVKPLVPLFKEAMKTPLGRH